MPVETLVRPVARVESKVNTSINEKVYALSQAELINPNCIAYHGTSIETIEHMLRFGSIPGYTADEYQKYPTLPQYGDVYFGPRENVDWNAIPSTKEVAVYGTEYDIWSTGEIAESNAKRHHFCKFLGLPIAMYGWYAGSLIENYGKANADMREARAALNPLHIPEERIEEAVIAAKRRKGVIVGLHRNALKVFPFSEGDCGDDIRISQGMIKLTPDYLTVIHPLGEEERQFFNKLVA